jgi:hypothetical protein
MMSKVNPKFSISNTATLWANKICLTLNQIAVKTSEAKNNMILIKKVSKWKKEQWAQKCLKTWNHSKANDHSALA